MIFASALCSALLSDSPFFSFFLLIKLQGLKELINRNSERYKKQRAR
jgi:hypothetical protein